MLQYGWNLKHVKKKLSHKGLHIVWLFIWNVQNKHIYRARNSTSGCYELVGGENKWLLWVWGFGGGGDENDLKLIVVTVAQACEYIKAMESYILDGLIWWDVNYISVTMFFRRQYASKRLQVHTQGTLTENKGGD